MSSRVPDEPRGVVALAVAGITLFVVAGLLFANLNEDPTLFGAAAFAALATGLYLLVAGAVAHGIALARSAGGTSPGAADDSG